MLRSTLLLIAVGLISITSVSAQPADMVSVREHGAVGDGEADDTQAFLDAIAAAKQAGMHVYVPRGTYRISKVLTLENIGITGPQVGAWPADIDALPAILPIHTDAPAFHLLAGGSLRGLDITDRRQYEGETGQPAVLISGIGVYISNCRIRYPWDGIITDGKTNVGRLNIENVFMVSPRNVGVRVTGTWDVPALRNVEVWNAGPVARGLEKGIGFHLGKNDLIRVTDCFAFAMRYGFLLEDKIEGCEIEGGTWGTMNGCATDFCGTGLEVRGSNTVSVNGCTFWDHRVNLSVVGEDARVRVSGSELKSNGAPCVVVDGGDHVAITGCSILRTMESFDAPAVEFRAGRLVLTGNQIESAGPGVVVGEGVTAGVVQGNIIDAHGNPALVISPGAAQAVSVSGNLEQPADPKRPVK